MGADREWKRGGGVEGGGGGNPFEILTRAGVEINIFNPLARL